MKISQSTMKKFLWYGESHDQNGELYHCPYEIYKTSVIGGDSNPTDAMKDGIYFETLCIGSGARGQVINDLPRKKLSEKRQIENEMLIRAGKQPKWIAEKTIDQIRIEGQAMVFKQVAQAYRIRIDQNTTQQTLTKTMPDGNILEGTLDIHNTPMLHNGTLLPSVTIDVKLTKTIHSEFPPFCWGTPERIDHTQPMCYSHLSGNPFFYLVFDYKSNPEWKIIGYQHTKTKELEFLERYRKVVELYTEYDRSGWYAVPKFSRCKKCPCSFLNGGDCEKAETIQIL